jgi:hypothetical protein
MMADAEWVDFAGAAVSLSGTTALVGVPNDDDVATLGGSAVFFRFDGLQWSQEQKVLAPDGGYSEMFGSAVAVQGDVAVIGAPKHSYSDNQGAVYVYRFDGVTWQLEEQLTASDATNQQHFGTSIELEGSCMVIGAPSTGGSNSSAYVFEHDGNSWIEQQKIVASVASGHFARAMSLEGDVLIIGAAQGDGAAFRSGIAFVYRHDGSSWIEEEILQASDGAYLDFFGVAVALSDNRVLIGAHRKSDIAPDAGAVYEFQYDGNSWNETDQIYSSTEREHYGRAVELRDDLALIGASNEGARLNTPSVYLYRHDGTEWVQRDRLIASDTRSVDRLGESLSLDGDLLLAGAPQAEEVSGGYAVGAGYLFRVTKLELRATPKVILAGETLTVLTRRGAPNNFVLKMIVEVNGAPLTIPLLLLQFAADGVAQFSTPVPAGLEGIQVTFQSIGVEVEGDIVLSNRDAVLFQ